MSTQHTQINMNIKDAISQNTDKILHFIVCGWLFFVVALPLKIAWPGILLSSAWGLYREIKGSTFDWLDLAADTAGIIFAFALWSR